MEQGTGGNVLHGILVKRTPLVIKPEEFFVYNYRMTIKRGYEKTL